MGRNHIVVASDAMNSAYVQAGVHELVHNLQRESSAYYDAFSSVVLDTLKKDGSFDLQAAVAERIRQYAEQGQQLSEEDALEEIVAEAAPAALTNREAMRAFVNENRSLAEKVRDFFVRFADELREIAAKYGVGNSREEVNAMLRAEAQDLVNIAEALDMALSAAQESAQVGVSETESTSGEDTVYSIRPGVKLTEDQIQENIRTVAGMESVATVETFAFTQGKIKQDIIEYFVSVGGKVENAMLGTVTLNSRGVKDSFAHGLGEAKVAAFRSVPAVIENGLIIDWESNWKGRQYDSAVLAAPVDITKGEEKNRYYVGVVVIRNTDTQRFYTHEVVIQKEDGNRVVLNRGSENQNLPGNAYRPIKSILDQINDVNPSAEISPETDEGTKFSLKDSEAFKKWFGDSKIVNRDGSPKVMYHGSTASFTVFDKKKARSSGLYGRGFYFTDSDSHAGQYGSLYQVYLKVENPLTPDGSTVTRAQAKKFLEVVAENEDYSIENYGTYDVGEILKKAYQKDAFALIQDVNATAIGDFVEAVKLFNEVNGTKYDGIVAPTETVVFEPTQIKSATNNSGAFDAANPDIRFSLKSPVEETRDLVAVHNLTEKNLLASLKLGGLPSPSIAIVRAESGYSMYGPISLVFDKHSIDPENADNRVYGGDAWTPTRQSTEYTTLEDIVEEMNTTQKERGEGVDSEYGALNRTGSRSPHGEREMKSRCGVELPHG